MQWPLVLAGLAMGVAATPHCAAMCAAPCAGLTQGCGRSTAGFHVGRVLGYMAGGAVAASSVAALGLWSEAAPVMRPLWTLLHLALLALGLWWLATGRQLDFMKRSTAVTIGFADRQGRLPAVRRPVRASLAGLAWVAWPCAAMQGALLLAALANSAEGGALVMAAFAVGSMPSLALAPWAWGRWRAWRQLQLGVPGGSGAAGASAGVGAGGGAGVATDLTSLGLRVAGLGIALSSGWALTHGLWQRFAAWCAT